MVDPVTTQNVVSGLSSLLTSQRPEVMYGLPVALMVVGGTFWFLGHQIHRLFLMAVFLAGGIYGGWWAGNLYGFDGINAILAMAVGGLLGAGIGYWLFRLWLGILASGLIALLLIILYASSIGVPYLQSAKQGAQEELNKNGITSLAPGPSSRSARPLHLPGAADVSPSANSSVGEAYNGITAHLPKLSPAQYETWSAWREAFGTEAQTVWSNLLVILPNLRMDLYLTAGVGLILGLVFAFVRPTFLDVAYTSLLGLLLVAGGTGLLVALKDLSPFAWVAANLLAATGGLAALWLTGLAIQYKMIPSPPPAEGEEGEEEPEKEKSEGGKKKK